MIEVDLTDAIEGVAPAPLYLRDLRGEDELADLAGPLQLARLVDGLLVDVDGQGAAPRRAGDLTLAEFDRALAGLFAALYGDLVECHVVCTRCGEGGELSFSLAEFAGSVVESAREAAVAVAGPDDAGVYSTGEGARFRLPTVSDLAAATGEADPVAALARRCVVGGEADAGIEAAMAAIAPLLESEIDTECVACGADTATRFAIGDFLAAALRRERPIVLREIHTLARAYAWSRGEIVALPRAVRREHVALILADSDGEGGL